MQHLNNLWKAAQVVGSVRDLTVDSKVYQWDVTLPCTFFLEVEHADITLKRHSHEQVTAKVALQAGFGWQLVTDQDSAGVYIIAKRKRLIGSVGRGKFYIALPHAIHTTLKLEHCTLTLDNLSTTLDFPPTDYPIES